MSADLPEPDWDELTRRFTSKFMIEFDELERASGRKVEPNQKDYRDRRAIYVANQVTVALNMVEQRWNAAHQAEASMRLTSLFQR